MGSDVLEKPGKKGGKVGVGKKRDWIAPVASINGRRKEDLRKRSRKGGSIT